MRKRSAFIGKNADLARFVESEEYTRIKRAVSKAIRTSLESAGVSLQDLCVDNFSFSQKDKLHEQQLKGIVGQMLSGSWPKYTTSLELQGEYKNLQIVLKGIEQLHDTKVFDKEAQKAILYAIELNNDFVNTLHGRTENFPRIEYSIEHYGGK